MYDFLYIEDNVTDMYLFEQMVNESHGPPPCLLHHAHSLSEGLAKLESNAYDGVLVDLTLHDSGGLATLDAVTSAHPHLPIIVLTSTADDALGVGALERGAQDYLVKDDVNLGSLSRAILHAIERKRLQDELKARNRELQAALDEVKLLRGLVRVCSVCKRIVDDDGRWQPLDAYVRSHIGTNFTHGYCPECTSELEKELDET